MGAHAHHCDEMRELALTLIWNTIKTSGLIESASLMKHFALMWS